MRNRGAEGGLVPAGDIIKAMPLPKLAPKTAFDSDFIPPEDIAYTHSIFLQCFMPLRHTAANKSRWQTNNKDASLVIRAGELINPKKVNHFKECVVPAGPKARIIAAYINDFAWRHKTQEIDLGKSLRKFMDRADVRICGSNAKELMRELENFASAEILLGGWNPGVSAVQASSKVAKGMSFWIEKDEKQRTLWQPSMLLSSDYYSAVIEGGHIAPIHWPSYMGLQASPRAMDILSFLTYRLRKPLQRPVELYMTEVHKMFGQDCKRLAHFLPRFEADLKKAWQFYQTARVEITKETDITKRKWVLYNSPPLIPYRKVAYIGA